MLAYLKTISRFFSAAVLFSVLFSLSFALLCLPLPASAFDGYYNRDNGFGVCQQQGLSLIYPAMRGVEAPVTLPADVEAAGRQQVPPPVTTSFIHEAALTMHGLYAEPVTFMEQGLWRFRKRQDDVAQGLTAEELTAEPPQLNALILPAVDILPSEPLHNLPDMATYMPPDITRGRADRMDVAITFDGGSEDNDAAVILKALRERGIKTTIFLTGEFIANYPALVRQMVADGHEIGNHTMSHPHLTDFERTYRHVTLKGVDKAMLSRELREAAKLFKDVTGVEMAPLWRAPYGEANAEIRRWAFEEGYVHVGWTYDSKARESLDTLDWVADVTSRLYRTSNEIRDNILNFGKGKAGGGIVLMHLGTGRKTDKASSMLGEMLDGLKARGYRLVKLSTLLDGETPLRYVRMIKQERIMKGMVRLDSK